MLRLHALVLTILSGFASTTLWRGQPPVADPVNDCLTTRLDAGVIADRQDALQEMSLARDRFGSFIDELTEELRSEQVDLITARERLLFFALGQHPDYLDNVSNGEEGRTLREKVARNLLRGLYEASRIDPRGEGDAPLLERYERELRDHLTSQPQREDPV